jgi:hypothetical protein
VLLALALLAGLSAIPGAKAAESATTMTDEDVVRLHVSGVDPQRIVERIDASEPAFDLSDEMLAELRAAGLPELLIRAMLDRTRAWEAEHAPPAESDETATAHPTQPGLAAAGRRTAAEPAPAGRDRTPGLRTSPAAR